MELAERMEESAEDMTAADTAPSPMNDTHEGHRYCITIGRINFWSSAVTLGWPHSVAFQSNHERSYRCV